MSLIKERHWIATCSLNGYLDSLETVDREVFWKTVKNEQLDEFYDSVTLTEICPKVDREGNCTFNMNIVVNIFESKRNFRAFHESGYDESKRERVKIQCTPIKPRKKDDENNGDVLV
ncbi:MAG TPA: hypothetical protein P5244_01295 [Syntrophales bacterium]|nr:hypothetical protein [Syntrophales bacterium]HRV28992.1 hypothetical protein [Spirochaetia bacterium]